jgi:hypothetical protein
MIASTRFSLPALLPCLTWLTAIFSFIQAPCLAASDLRLLPQSRVSSEFERSKAVQSCSLEVCQSIERRFLNGSTGQATLRDCEREPQGDGTRGR